MVEKQNSVDCNVMCWGVAAVIGFIAMVMLYLLAEFSALQAIFVGGLIGTLIGLVLSLFVCRGQKAAADLGSDEKPAQRYAREAAEAKAKRAGASGSGGAGATAASDGSGAAGAGAAVAGAASAGAGAGQSNAGGTAGGAGSAATANSASSSAAGAGTGEAGSASGAESGGQASAGGAGSAADAGLAAGEAGSAAGTSSDATSGAGAGNAASAAPASFMPSGLKPSAPLAGEAELAGRKGDWKYEGAADAEPAKKSAKKAAPAAKAAEKSTPSEASPDAKAAPVAATGGASADADAPAAKDGEPALYTAPPAGGGDDLKLISGVGPKLEQTLNDMGIYRFAQVAVWGAQDIAWVDDRLRFKGRIERDDWMSQAKILAEGGETEFSQRKKK